MKTGERSINVLGITGGVGAGKSTVLSYLKDQYGAYILEADQVGHIVQQPGHACWKQIVDTFGCDILNEDQTIDRGRLGAIVYADRKKLELLNAIVHPAVRLYIEDEISRLRESDTLVVIEAALLLEAHYDEICDEVWYIYADEKTRIKRLMRSRGYTEERARQIMGNQLSDAEFRRSCSVVIDNGEDCVNSACRQIDDAMKRISCRFSQMLARGQA